MVPGFQEGSQAAGARKVALYLGPKKDMPPDKLEQKTSLGGPEPQAASVSSHLGLSATARLLKGGAKTPRKVRTLPEDNTL